MGYERREDSQQMDDRNDPKLHKGTVKQLLYGEAPVANDMAGADALQELASVINAARYPADRQPLALEEEGTSSREYAMRLARAALNWFNSRRPAPAAEVTVELSSAEHELNRALCGFCNQIGDPFKPASQWDEICSTGFKRLTRAYSDWYVWLKEAKGNPFATPSPEAGRVPLAWLREIDAGTPNACWVNCAKGDPGAIAVTALAASQAHDEVKG